MKRNWILLGLVLLLIGGTIYKHITGSKEASSMAEGAAPKQGFKAPAFTLKALDGRSYSVGGKRDKPLLVNFWASWCEPCQQEAPDLQALYEKYKDRFDLYGVNITSQDTLPEIEAFVKKYNLTFPILLDPGDDARGLYQLRAIPTSFLVDTNGTIVELIYVVDPQQLEQQLLSLLEKSH